MTLNSMLETLYGKVADGALSVTHIDNSKCVTKYFGTDDLPSMAKHIQECGHSYNTYIGINPRVSALAPYKRGSREDIASVVCAYQDFDIQGPAHKETSLPGTQDELISFLDELPLAPTILVATGNGIHAYWVFEEPFVIRNDADRDYIESALRGFEQYVHDIAFRKYGWRFDPVSDLPRMLRAPGTQNFKTDSLPLCEIIRFTESFYKVDSFPGNTTTNVSNTDEDFSLIGTGSSDELIEKCEFIKYCRDNAKTLPEPLWHAMIGNLALTADGKDAVHRLSSPYPGYTFEETESKIIRAVKEDKPTTCEYIRSKLGYNCNKACNVKSPIALVHSSVTYDRSWEEPIPFDSYNLPEFPVDALPQDIADYVLAVAESTQTPPDMAAVTAISIMSLCLQGNFKVQPKADWEENLNTFCLICMDPSERKSAVVKAMAKPLNSYEHDWNVKHSSDIDFSKTQSHVLEKKLKITEDQFTKGKATMEELRRASDELSGFKVKKPMQLYSDDVTTEKLISILSDNNGKAAILSAEAGIFDMLKGIYTKYVNIDVFLKGYSGDAIRVDRVGRESECIMNPTLTLLLMAQTSVLSGIMQNEIFKGRGLLARFLYCIPVSGIGKRKYHSKPVPDEIYRSYERRITSLISNEPDVATEVITFSDDADRLLSDFAEELEPKLRNEYQDISAWAGKLIGNIARIAGLLCRTETAYCVDFLAEEEPLVVTGKQMVNAIRIGRYFLEHARAAFSIMGSDDKVRKCKTVLSAIKSAGLLEFNRRDIMRLNRSFKTAEMLQPILDQLIDYGYIAVKENPNYSGRGRPPTPVYIVNPYLFGSQ